MPQQWQEENLNVLCYITMESFFSITIPYSIALPFRQHKDEISGHDANEIIMLSSDPL